jgi:ribosomal protein L29
MTEVQKDVRALQEEVAEYRKELFNLRMKTLTGQVKDTSQFKKIRKKIAQAMTQVSKTAHNNVK